MTSTPADRTPRSEDAEVRVPESGHHDPVVNLEPLDVDGVHTLAVGSVLWLVVLLVLLPFVDELRDTDRLWWLWTCLTGVCFGLIGLEYCRRRRNSMRMQPGDSPVETSRFGAAG